MHKLLGVCFFTKMKMRSNRVLEEMDEQISAKDEKPGIRPAQLNALRHHFDQRRSQHEPRAERNKIAEVRPIPMLLNNDGAAEHISARRRQPQQQTGQNGRHEGKE